MFYSKYVPLGPDTHLLKERLSEAQIGVDYRESNLHFGQQTLEPKMLEFSSKPNVCPQIFSVTSGMYML